MFDTYNLSNRAVQNVTDCHFFFFFFSVLSFLLVFFFFFSFSERVCLIKVADLCLKRDFNTGVFL